jgi:hypothetical protein
MLWQLQQWDAMLVIATSFMSLVTTTALLLLLLLLIPTCSLQDRLP